MNESDWRRCYGCGANHWHFNALDDSATCAYCGSLAHWSPLPARTRPSSTQSTGYSRDASLRQLAAMQNVGLQQQNLALAQSQQNAGLYSTLTQARSGAAAFSFQPTQRGLSTIGLSALLGGLIS